LYNRNLQNRNALLRQITVTGKYDPELLNIYDDQLVLSGNRIFNKRRAFMDVFMPIFDQHYKYLCQEAESVGMVYESPLLRADFSDLLKQNLERDRVLERTTVGIHKDDLVFTLGGMPLKKFGSQGQQKSFLIALKLAQYTFFQHQKGFKPLLLLDDIFDKLDENRTRKLMKMVSDKDFGQIFITDTSRRRIENIFNEIDILIRIFDIEKGTVEGQSNPV
jgi:DNA replication and repair protein RecF